MPISKRKPARARRRTVSKVRGRPPVRICDQEAPAGALTQIEIPVARLVSGNDSTLRVAVIHGAKKGPTIWVSAAVHGDELNGVQIIRRLLRRIDPMALSGTVLAVPVVNVFGLLLESRYMPDRRDLNRSFPGRKKGPLASQLAHIVMTEIVSRCALGIDLHTGSDGRTNLPQIRCDMTDPKTARFARAFGAPIILDSRHRAGSLRAEAASRGAKVLVYEAGEALRFDTAAIDTGVDGVLRVMERIGMGSFAAPSPEAKSLRASESHWLRAGASGLCEVLVQLGSRVKKGDTVAVVWDTACNDLYRVQAKSRGIVIGLVNHSLVYRGDAVAHVAVVGSRGRKS